MQQDAALMRFNCNVLPCDRPYKSHRVGLTFEHAAPAHQMGLRHPVMDGCTCAVLCAEAQTCA